MKPILQVEHLSHYFGEQPALNDLSLEAHTGDVLGLLGPNGAGKTTSIRLINGLYPVHSGNIRVMDMDPSRDGEKIRQMTGVLTENPALYERLTARQNLQFFGQMHDMKTDVLKHRIAEMLSFFELNERSEEPVGQYSKGMKQRLALARALLTRPPLLFLDEPTSGLDPEAARQVENIIETVCRQNGQTVILCTHHLHEAERLCNRVAIINHGKLLAGGTLKELYSLNNSGLTVEIKLYLSTAETARSALLSLVNAENIQIVSTNQIEIKISEEALVPQIIGCLVNNNIQIYSVLPQQPSLEKVYFALQEQSNRGVL